MVGILGGGNISRQVAKKVQAFGATTQYYDVFRLGEEREAALGMPYKPLDELLQTSDIITLHIPLLDSTFHIIGERELALMKKDAILVNTARGGGTADLGDKIIPMLAEDIDTFAEGKLPAHTVNKAYFN